LEYCRRCNLVQRDVKMQNKYIYISNNIEETKYKI